MTLALASSTAAAAAAATPPPFSSQGVGTTMNTIASTSTLAATSASAQTAAAATATEEPLIAISSSSINWAKRLAWVKYPPTPTTTTMTSSTSTSTSTTARTSNLLWPAVIYESDVEFDQLFAAQADQYKVKLGLLMMQHFATSTTPSTTTSSAAATTGGGAAAAAIRVVRFLGRPLDEVDYVADGQYLDFFRHLGEQLKNVVCHPEAFVGIGGDSGGSSGSTSGSGSSSGGDNNDNHNYNHNHDGTEKALYHSFHQGMEESSRLMHACPSDSGNHTASALPPPVAFVEKAQAAWDAYHGTLTEGPISAVASPRQGQHQGQGHATTTQQQGGPRYRRRQAIMAASPNHSVAAVSLAEESLVSAVTHATNTTPATVGTALKNNAASENQYQYHNQYQSSSASATPDEYSSSIGFPKLSEPIGRKTWFEAYMDLQCVGWMRFVSTTSTSTSTTSDPAHRHRYQPYGGGPELLESQVQQIAKDVYGWQPTTSSPMPTTLPTTTSLPHVQVQNVQSPVLQTTRTTRRTRPAPDTPASNAKEYTFGFLWKYHLQPKGWTKVHPPRPAAKMVDWYYLTPGVTLANLEPSTKNETYFDDHYEVLDYCQRHKDYPSSSGSSSSSSSSGGSSDDSSVQSMSPAAVLRERRAETSGKKRNGHENNNDDDDHNSPKHYSFGVLWAVHLDPKGWTMEPPKKRKNSRRKNSLVDYYYIQPNKTVEDGIEGIDYFATMDAVLDYCAHHADYPTTSGAEDNADDNNENGNDAAAAAAASQWTDAETTLTGGADSDEGADHDDDDDDDDDESTKVPAETEDDGTVYTVETYLTPNNRTQPQDPSKPLLGFEGEDGIDNNNNNNNDSASELDDAQKYDWRNLWPFLKNLGWTYRAAPNRLDNYWYQRPRKLGLTDTERARPLQPGLDYFTTEAAVIAYCREEEDKELKEQQAQQSQLSAGVSTATTTVTADFESTSSTKGRTRIPNGKTPAAATKKTNALGMKKQAPTKKNTNKNTKKSKPIKKEEIKTKTVIDVVVKPEDNQAAPWVKDPILVEGLHKWCCEVGQLTFQNNLYYLPNESYQKYTHRFESLDDFRAHYCQLGEGQYQVRPDEAQSVVEAFHRWIRYSSVPGRFHEHSCIRKLTRFEVQTILVEDIKCTVKDRIWTPPKAFAGILRSTYPSLSALLKDLCPLPDLRGPISDRRRGARQSTPNEHHRMMALRLYIVEPSLWQSPKRKRKGNSGGGGGADSQAGVVLKKRASLSTATTMAMDDDDDELDFDRDCQENEASPSATAVTTKTKRSRSAKEVGSANSGKKRSASSDIKTSSSTKQKTKKSKPAKPTGPAPNSTVDLRVKASDSGSSRRKPPWAALRKDMWHVAQAMGISWRGGQYYLPNERPNHCCQSFSSLDQIFVHYGTYGGYILDMLDEDSRLAVEQRIAYAHVPQTFTQWVKVRLLRATEATRLLEPLNFKLNDDRWEVPEDRLLWVHKYREGEPSLLQPTYASLQDLRRALRCIPDLECNDGGTRRRRESSIFNDYQLMALRLWLAKDVMEPEGSESSSSSSKEHSSSNNDNDNTDDSSNVNDFEEDESKGSSPEDPEEQTNDKDSNVKIKESDSVEEEEISDSDDDSTKQAMVLAIELCNSVCRDNVAWTLLQRFGAQWTGAMYKIPNPSFRFTNLNDLAQHLMEHILDFEPDENCKLNREELAMLHRWLKFKHVRLLSYSLVKEALTLMQNPDNISSFLNKVGFSLAATGYGDMVYILKDTNRKFGLDEVVNIIRKTEQLGLLVPKSTISGRPSRDVTTNLSTVEELALRIWAAEDKSPLLFFDEEGFAVENCDTGDDDSVEEGEILMDEDGPTLTEDRGTTPYQEVAPTSAVSTTIALTEDHGDVADAMTSVIEDFEAVPPAEVAKTSVTDLNDIRMEEAEPLGCTKAHRTEEISASVQENESNETHDEVLPVGGSNKYCTTTDSSDAISSPEEGHESANSTKIVPSVVSLEVKLPLPDCEGVHIAAGVEDKVETKSSLTPPQPSPYDGLLTQQPEDQDEIVTKSTPSSPSPSDGFQTQQPEDQDDVATKSTPPSPSPNDWLLTQQPEEEVADLGDFFTQQPDEEKENRTVDKIHSGGAKVNQFAADSLASIAATCKSGHPVSHQDLVQSDSESEVSTFIEHKGTLGSPLYAPSPSKDAQDTFSVERPSMSDSDWMTQAFD